MSPEEKRPAERTGPLVVTLYSRQDCHLCEEARDQLHQLQAELPHRLKVVDIDRDLALQRAYGFEIPVVEVGPYRLKAPFTPQELRMTLAAAQDREQHIARVEKSQALSDLRERGVWTWADKTTLWISRHYLAALNLIVLVYLGLPFLAPFLMQIGWTTPANLIYRGYGLVCHQLAYRSFFIFGEQPFYPRAAAHVDGYLTLGQATGLSEEGDAEAIFAARNYVGDEQAGYKVALCERDIAIYAGILLFGLVFALTGCRLPPLPWYLWILFGLVPVGLDGLSQLASQPPLSLFPFRESTPFLRVLTGGLFGAVTAWFSYPLVEETMADSRELMEGKLRRIRATPPPAA